MAYSAVNYGAPRKDAGRGRRSARQTASPLYERAKLVADNLWERANAMADILAPDVPADAEELTEHEQYLILERASIAFSPAWWEDPDALDALYAYRKKFAGRESPELKAYATLQRERQRHMPDASITPQSPEWEAQRRRMRR